MRGFSVVNLDFEEKPESHVTASHIPRKICKRPVLVLYRMDALDRAIDGVARANTCISSHPVPVTLPNIHPARCAIHTRLDTYAELMHAHSYHHGKSRVSRGRMRVCDSDQIRDAHKNWQTRSCHGLHMSDTERNLHQRNSVNNHKNRSGIHSLKNSQINWNFHADYSDKMNDREIVSRGLPKLPQGIKTCDFVRSWLKHGTIPSQTRHFPDIEYSE